MSWENRKPYYSLSTYIKDTYGEKCYKIAIDAGLTCPNRDGSIGRDGCLFCSAGGSGDFAVKRSAGNITDQLQAGLAMFGDKKTGSRYIAYFQAYTNTYGPIAYLSQTYREALDCPAIIGISIATRPDCLGSEVMLLLRTLRLAYPDKFIWIELGLQTIHEQTAISIRRGYPLSVFDKAAAALQEAALPFIVHVILGLPGETPAMMYDTVQYLNAVRPFGVKLQLLHILKDTQLGIQYLHQPEGIAVLTQEEYTDILIHCLELLAPGIVIHRVTGDGPKELLLAPLWSLHKRNVLNTIHRTMQIRDAYQGRLYHDA